MRKFTSNFHRYFVIENGLDTTLIRQLTLKLIDSISADGYSFPESFNKVGRFEVRKPLQKVDGRYMEVGSLKLSRVSLNKDYDEALFYYQYAPAGSGVRRIVCFAKKEGNIWRKKTQLLLWD